MHTPEPAQSIPAPSVQPATLLVKSLALHVQAEHASEPVQPAPVINDMGQVVLADDDGVSDYSSPELRADVTGEQWDLFQTIWAQYKLHYSLQGTSE